MDRPSQINAQARNLILDYALGATIITLLPLPRLVLAKLITLALLSVLLIFSLAKLWHFQKGSDLLAKSGIVFGIFGSISVAVFTWMGTIFLSTLIPPVGLLASGVAVFFYFWGIGQTVHHFYLSKAHSPLRNKIQAPQDMSEINPKVPGKQQ